MELQQIKLTNLSASKTNPRTEFVLGDQEELIESIRLNGLKEPLIVRPKNGNFEIIDGERRWRAIKELQYNIVDCVVIDASDDEAIDIQLASHLQRANIGAMEEAELYGLMTSKRGLTIPIIANRTGKPASHITNRLQLLELIGPTKQAFKLKIITIDHATLLARLIPEDQKRALEWLIGTDILMEENKWIKTAKDARLLRDWIRQEISLDLDVAPFDTCDPGLVSGVPACTVCPYNSKFNTELFNDERKGARCGDRHCFNRKVQAHIIQEAKKTRKEEKLQFVMISSTDFMSSDDPLKVPGKVKMNGRYRIVRKPGECKNTKRAQYIDGPRKGKKIFVCNYSKCTKHWPRSYDKEGAGRRPEAIEKERIKQHDHAYEINTAIAAMDKALDIYLDKSGKALTKFETRILAASVVESMGWSVQKDLKKRFGVSGTQLWRQLSAGKIDERKTVSILLFVFMHDIIHDGNYEELKPLMWQRGINVDRLLVEVRKMTPICEHCHCSEEDACSNKCSWDAKFKSADRWVCTNCTSKVKAIKEQKAKTGS